MGKNVSRMIKVKIPYTTGSLNYQRHLYDQARPTLARVNGTELNIHVQTSREYEDIADPAPGLYSSASG
jgi:hypothetical protein